MFAALLARTCLGVHILSFLKHERVFQSLRCCRAFHHLVVQNQLVWNVDLRQESVGLYSERLQIILNRLRGKYQQARIRWLRVGEGGLFTPVQFRFLKQHVDWRYLEHLTWSHTRNDWNGPGAGACHIPEWLVSLHREGLLLSLKHLKVDSSWYHKLDSLLTNTKDGLGQQLCSFSLEALPLDVLAQNSAQNREATRFLFSQIKKSGCRLQKLCLPIAWDCINFAHMPPNVRQSLRSFHVTTATRNRQDDYCLETVVPYLQEQLILSQMEELTLPHMAPHDTVKVLFMLSDQAPNLHTLVLDSYLDGVVWPAFPSLTSLSCTGFAPPFLSLKNLLALTNLVSLDLVSDIEVTDLVFGLPRLKKLSITLSTPTARTTHEVFVPPHKVHALRTLSLTQPMMRMDMFPYLPFLQKLSITLRRRHSCVEDLRLILRNCRCLWSIDVALSLTAEPKRKLKEEKQKEELQKDKEIELPNLSWVIITASYRSLPKDHIYGQFLQLMLHTFKMPLLRFLKLYAFFPDEVMPEKPAAATTNLRGLQNIQIELGIHTGMRSGNPNLWLARMAACCPVLLHFRLECDQSQRRVLDPSAVALLARKCPHLHTVYIDFDGPDEVNLDTIRKAQKRSTRNKKIFPLTDWVLKCFSTHRFLGTLSLSGSYFTAQGIIDLLRNSPGLYCLRTPCSATLTLQECTTVLQWRRSEINIHHQDLPWLQWCLLYTPCQPTVDVLHTPSLFSKLATDARAVLLSF